jgi:hypothetical protein
MKASAVALSACFAVGFALCTAKKPFATRPFAKRPFAKRPLVSVDQCSRGGARATFPQSDAGYTVQSTSTSSVEYILAEKSALRLTPGRRRVLWWMVPAIAAVVSYLSFGHVSSMFHSLVLWISNDTWFPDTDEKVNLQSNVITQVVNGPVVTSISVLFATLISVTVSSLHSRQQDVQVSLINEIQALRQLQALLSSPLHHNFLSAAERHVADEQVDLLGVCVSTEARTTQRRPHKTNHHEYIDSQSAQLLTFCDEIELSYLVKPRGRHDPRMLLGRIRETVASVRTERKNRWVAVTSQFPAVHYFTLGLLVVSILLSFLVTTDEAEFIFLKGLQVRILWSVLVTCFSSLAVVCGDLADVYSGNYAVATDFG